MEIIIPKKSTKLANPFIGKWRITEMEVWDQDFVDLIVPGYIQFDKEKMGKFQFGAVQGHLDCRLEIIEGESRIEFSWDGEDENDPATGRGWAAIRDGKLFGRLYIHLGDDSWFKATKT
jgi:hypothetical protein